MASRFVLEVRIPVVDELVGGIEVKQHGRIEGQVDLANDRIEQGK